MNLCPVLSLFFRLQQRSCQSLCSCLLICSSFSQPVPHAHHHVPPHSACDSVLACACAWCSLCWLLARLRFLDRAPVGARESGCRAAGPLPRSSPSAGASRPALLAVIVTR